MSFSTCLQVFILSFLINNGVKAIEGDFDARKNEFNFKNMKTVLPTSDPDKFDCVDIYKQPAFDHPMLKNHKIQLEPDFISDSEKFSPKGSCPPGKVPIAKVTTSHPEDLHELKNSLLTQHFVVAESAPGYKLHGARSLIELYNPHPLQNFQFSMANLWVLGGPKNELNSIQAGWGVHPFLYKDNKTHLTIFSTTDNFGRTGCYNTQCSGFVQTHKFYYPGISFRDDAVDPKYHTVVDVALYQDVKTGNWWLILDGKIGVGYWPKQVLPHLAQEASQVRYGGWTGNLNNLPSPPMGNGQLPSLIIPRSSTLNKLRVLDSSYNEIETSDLKMSTRVDGRKCYSGWYSVTQDPVYRDLFMYGGPGGYNCGA